MPKEVDSVKQALKDFCTQQYAKINGIRIDKEVTDESEHFYICSVCGQAVDMRNLGQVLYHEDSEHDPLPLAS